MANTIRLTDIDALLRFEADLGRFTERVAETLQRVDVELLRVRHGLEERLADRRRAVGRCDRQAEAARDELQACQDRDDDNCDWAERALRLAEARLEEARERLASARRALDRVDVATTKYRTGTSPLRTFVAGRATTPRHFLKQRWSELASYVEVGPTHPSAAATTSSSGLAPGGAEISGFDASGASSDAGVRAYISSRVPPEHRTLFRHVIYSGRVVIGEDGIQDLGYTATPPGDGARVITIHADRQDGTWSDVAAMEDAIAHEVGHCVWAAVLSAEERDEWSALWERSSRRELVSEYAAESPEEDFVDSYAAWLNRPALLEATSSERRRFLDAHVGAATPSTADDQGRDRQG